MEKYIGVMMAAMLVFSGCGSQESATVQNSAPASSENIPKVAAPSNGALQGSGGIQGTVKFTGKAPIRESLQMSADPFCAANAGADAVNEALVVNENGTLRNAFVYIKDGLGSRVYEAPASTVTLDQQGCRYYPHVVGIQVGQPVEIINSDSTLHNVHAMPKESKEFNLGMPLKGMKIKKTFTAPEMGVRFKCDVHPWMSAYANVMSHPFFAVTGDDGVFEIKGLPPGDYTVAVWHETLGERETSVLVEASVVSLDLVF